MEEALPAVDPPSQIVTVSRKRLMLVLAGVLLSMSLGALDQTAVGTAVPRVIAELNGLGHHVWVFAAYMLASTMMILIFGTLSDLYGRRTFFPGGMLLFPLCSALSGASQNMTRLILIRAMQGLGAGAVMVKVQSIAGDVYSLIERGKWQGVIMSLWGIATIVCPAWSFFLLNANGFEVVDLGVDVSPARFVDRIRECQPDVVGLSGLLTVAAESMKKTVEAIHTAGLRDRIKIMIGSGMVDDHVRTLTGADAFGSDAMAAVSLAKRRTRSEACRNLQSC